MKNFSLEKCPQNYLTFSEIIVFLQLKNGNFCLNFIATSKHGDHTLPCGDQFGAPAQSYISTMAFVYVHVQCTVPGYKSLLMYRNKLVLS